MYFIGLKQRVLHLYRTPWVKAKNLNTLTLTKHIMALLIQNIVVFAMMVATRTDCVMYVQVTYLPAYVARI